MAIRIAKMLRFRWISICSITEEDIGYLEKHFCFHHLDYKDCYEGVQRPKLDVYKYYLFMIFHFPTFDERTRRVGIRSLNVFLGKNYIVTLSSQKDKYLQGYFLRARKQKRPSVPYHSLINLSGYKLYKILDIEYRKSLRVINEIGRGLSEVEEEVFLEKNKQVTKNLAIIRRNILNLRRILDPQIKMIDRLVNMKSKLVPEALSVYFDDVHDYLENMWSALDNYRDTINGLYDTNESFINQKTNHVIKMLTVISVALLPVTLIASIYGMNVTGLPLANHPIGLWMVFVIMAGIVAGSIYFAKKKKII
jgi:magnesium transporter